MQPEEHDGITNGDQGGASPAQSSSRGRLIAVRVLIAGTTLGLIVGMFAVWANRLLFNPDNWSNTSTQLLQNPDIRSSTANYLVDTLYANYDVPGLLKSGLPPQLDGLAAPAAAALRGPAVQGTERALGRPRVQDLWARANRATDQLLISVIDGGKGNVAVDQGAVTLNLGAVLDNVASRLGLPANVSGKLPPHVANLTVIKSNHLKFVQNVGKAIKGLALWLTILCPLLYALAVVLARGHRRRTLMTIGYAAVFAGVIVLFGRRLVETQITNALTNDASVKPAIHATIAIGTSLLVEVATAVILVGAVLVAASWAAGPARIARRGREAIAPFLRERPVGAYALTLGVLALVFIWNPIPATGTPAGIITFTVLALLGTAALARQTIAEFPAAGSAATTLEPARRTGSRGWRRSADPNGSPAPAPATTVEQLHELVALRSRGEITAEDYQTAKAQLLPK